LLKLVALFIVSPFTRKIFGLFRRLGGFGLLLFGALDSSFLFLPFGNDFLLIALVSANRTSLIWIYYVMMALAGSMIGVFVLDWVTRRLGQRGLKGLVDTDKVRVVQKQLRKRARRTLLVSALLPPPFPFTVVVMTASALQTKRERMFPAIFLGRLLRFIIEAMLALYFGRKLVRLMNSWVIEYAVYAVIIISIVGSIYSVYRWLRADSSKRIFRTRAASD